MMTIKLHPSKIPAVSLGVSCVIKKYHHEMKTEEGFSILMIISSILFNVNFSFFIALCFHNEWLVINFLLNENYEILVAFYFDKTNKMMIKRCMYTYKVNIVIVANFK